MTADDLTPPRFLQRTTETPMPNPAPTAAATRPARDPELAAITAIRRSLDALDAPSRKRVLAYLWDRYAPVNDPARQQQGV